MIDYLMPKLAMAMNEGTISEWLVSDGSYVNAGDPLATVETEKVAYDVESPQSGYFYSLANVGDTVPCDSLIGRFSDEPDDFAKQLSPSQSHNPSMAISAPDEALAVETRSHEVVHDSSKRIIASPLARKIARDGGLDLAGIVGTGPGGRIVKRDVSAAIERLSVNEPGSAAEYGEAVLARVPLSGIRGTIANRMQSSLQQTAQLTSNWESDITELLRVRATFAAREEQLGTRVSVNALLIKAMTYAIRQVPMANACVVDDVIEVYSHIHMGIAISIPGKGNYDSGLVVAVLRHVERMGLAEIDREMKALITRVRGGEATPDDLTGSTITLSSTAGIGPPGLMSTPILNHPNVALLGPSTPIERPRLVEGKWVSRSHMPLSFTFDHRALDGEPAARFMTALHDALEHPELMMT